MSTTAPQASTTKTRKRSEKKFVTVVTTVDKIQIGDIILKTGDLEASSNKEHLTVAEWNGCTAHRNHVHFNRTHCYYLHSPAKVKRQV